MCLVNTWAMKAAPEAAVRNTLRPAEVAVCFSKVRAHGSAHVEMALGRVAAVTVTECGASTVSWCSMSNPPDTVPR